MRDDTRGINAKRHSVGSDLLRKTVSSSSFFPCVGAAATVFVAFCQLQPLRAWHNLAIATCSARDF